MLCIGGRALLVSLLKSAVLHHFNFKHPVEDIKYSQCGRFVLARSQSHFVILYFL